METSQPLSPSTALGAIRAGNEIAAHQRLSEASDLLLDVITLMRAIDAESEHKDLAHVGDENGLTGPAPRMGALARMAEAKAVAAIAALGA